MKLSRRDLNFLIESLLKESFDIADINKLGQEAVDALIKDGYKKARLGRTKEGDDATEYGVNQNAIVFARGPFRADLRKYFQRDKDPEVPKDFEIGDYYLGEVYGRGGLAEDIFIAYKSVIENYRFNKSAYGLSYKEPLTLFQIHEKFKKDYKSNTSGGGIHYYLGTKSLEYLLTHILENPQGSQYAFEGPQKMWIERASNTDPSLGTHLNGGAFDLGGYTSKTSKKDLNKMKEIVNNVARKYGTRIADWGAEVDHIHVGLRIK